MIEGYNIQDKIGEIAIKEIEEFNRLFRTSTSLESNIEEDLTSIEEAKKNVESTPLSKEEAIEILEYYSTFKMTKDAEFVIKAILNDEKLLSKTKLVLDGSYIYQIEYGYIIIRKLLKMNL